MSEHVFPVIKKVCAVGAGTMGIGTAIDYAKEGYDVSLYVREDSQKNEIYNASKRHKVIDGISAVLADMAQYDLIDKESIFSIKARIKVTSDLYEAAKDADFVMESIRERVQDKQEIFLQLDNICPPHTIFATNTSALNPVEIASVLSERRRQQFIVLHGFNPPHLMPLVEVVPSEETSLAVINNAVHLLDTIGKRPVRLHKATPGFIGNYIQSAIIWAALKLHVEYKIEPFVIDGEFREMFGRSYETLGPLELEGFEAGHLPHAEAKALLNVYNEKPASNSSICQIHRAAVRAALEIVAGGTASAREVEYAFVHSLGRRYGETGPLESADMGGLDIFQSIFSTLGYLDHDTAVGAWLERKVQCKDTGTKSDYKKGVYTWTPEMIAEVGGRRKKRLVEFLHTDRAHRSMNHQSNGMARHRLEAR